MTRSIFVAASLGILGFSLVGCSSDDGTSADDANEVAQGIAGARGVPVDFPAKSRTPVVDTATAATMKYFGGPVIANPKVYVVWWGDPTKINPVLTAAKGGIADFFAGITNSKYVDGFNEYDTAITTQAGSHAGSAGTGQHIGRGNYVGTRTLTAIPAGNVTDDQIQATIDAAITAGTLPAADDNTIYALYFPPGVTITLTGNGSSCSSFGAYHFATTETTRHRAYYLVMPDCGSSFKGFTDVTSHELAEAMTDAVPTPGSNPDYPQAWNDSGGSEVGDLCEGTSGTVKTSLGTFTVQGFWDEASHACKVSRAYTKDFNVAFAKNALSVAVGATATAQVTTQAVKGGGQALKLSVVAPAGVTATISPTQITSGGTATVTVKATSAASAVQVIVHADGTTGTAAQTHTAALLVDAH